MQGKNARSVLLSIYAYMPANLTEFCEIVQLSDFVYWLQGKDVTIFHDRRLQGITLFQT